MSVYNNKKVLSSKSASLSPDFRVKSLSEYMSSFPDFVSKEAANSVSSFFQKFIRGDNSDHTSSFCWLIPKSLGFGKADKDFNREAISDHIQLLLENNELYKTSHAFRDFELGQKKSVGTTSIILPYSHKNGLKQTALKYFASDTGYSYDQNTLMEAYGCVYTLLPPASVFPDPIDSVYDRADKNTNWGFPYWKKGNEVYDETQTWSAKYLELSKEVLLGRSVLKSYPAGMVCRVQPNGSKEPKQRVAWAISHVWTLLESRYQYPCLLALKFKDEFSEHYGKNRTDSFVTKMFSKSVVSNCNIIGFDASSYDTTISKSLVNLAYDLVGQWCGCANDDILLQCRNYMTSSDLVTPDGVYMGRQKGVASGMAMTNLVDSLVQLILFHYTRIKLNVDRSDCMVTVNGDDGIWMIPGLSPSLLSEIMNEFNMEVNPLKVSSSKDYVTFCQRLYLRNYKLDGRNVGIRSSFRTLNSIINYERYKNPDKVSPVFDSIRCIMQLEDMKYNPIFYHCVDLCVNADKRFGLGTNLGGGTSELFKIGSLDISDSGLLADNSWERKKVKDFLSGNSKLVITRYLDSNLCPP